MKRLILLTLATLPLFAFTANFVYCDYDNDDGYWCDEYWEPDPEWCDGYWVYYPHGYYCVYYVWYHPWWWDWYWWHCHWCHHFDWHFFSAGFYVVWYEDGCWWWRPRYGRWVRYKLPYGYAEFRYKAKSYGVNLPDKPPREINLPYNEKEVIRLTKEKDPQLYARIEKEYKTGNLEKMRKDYEVKMKKEIAVKNEEYKKTRIQHPSDQNERYKDETNRNIRSRDDERYNQQKSVTPETKIIKKPRTTYDESDNIPEEREQKRNTINPRRTDQNDAREEYNEPEKPKTPIRNLPPTNPDNEKRMIRKGGIEKSRR
uniref:DUF3300 domain-containing protein n=1 Tax=candidate division WOR-3 bacterium TaxID=2052148 RepID=A0A7C6AG72_UNCW3